MIAGYSTPRDYLDDLIALVERMLERHQAPRATAVAEVRKAAERELDIARREELLAARCETTRTAGQMLPFDRLRAAFELTDTEAKVLTVLTAFELSSAVRQAATPVLGDRSSTVTIELVEALVYRTPRERAASAGELTPDARLFRFERAMLGGAELPWLARPLRISPRVLELAMGRLRLDAEVGRVATLVDAPRSGVDLFVSSHAPLVVLDTLRNHPAGPIPLLVGPPGVGRGSIVFGAAAILGRPVLVVHGEALPSTPPELARVLTGIEREALLFGAVLLVRNLDALAGSTERNLADRLPLVASLLAARQGPVAVTAARPVWPASLPRPAVICELAIPGQEDRSAMWERVLGPGSASLAHAAAERYRITPGLITRAAATARAQATARGGALGFDDLRIGLRTQLDGELATLGKRVDWQQRWEDVVLTDEILDELRELVSRVRHRRQVLDDWGFGKKVAKGVGISALFSGPPGTGKTMVAGLIANELELDLYQIDVSRMVSKWIGETEKNLGRLFDAAAAGHAILLFDEADSLFARRTEVKSSNDRYANLEVNYLLQRMEEFEGITILTTNLESSVDEAFRRRLAFRIAFPIPESDERERLWRAMLPAAARIGPDIDFGSLARRFLMTGGYIRNAAIRAAYLAAAEGDAIRMRHLERGATLEYTAMGKIIHDHTRASTTL